MKISVSNVELKIIELEKRLAAQIVLTSMQQSTIDLLIKTQNNIMNNISNAIFEIENRISNIEDDIYEDE